MEHINSEKHILKSSKIAFSNHNIIAVAVPFVQLQETSVVSVCESNVEKAIVAEGSNVSLEETFVSDGVKSIISVEEEKLQMAICPVISCELCGVFGLSKKDLSNHNKSIDHREKDYANTLRIGNLEVMSLLDKMSDLDLKSRVKAEFIGHENLFANKQWVNSTIEKCQNQIVIDKSEKHPRGMIERKLGDYKCHYCNEDLISFQLLLTHTRDLSHIAKKTLVDEIYQRGLSDGMLTGLQYSIRNTPQKDDQMDLIMRFLGATKHTKAVRNTIRNQSLKIFPQEKFDAITWEDVNQQFQAHLSDQDFYDNQMWGKHQY
jgi:hypothetical protein